ncbi:MAG: biotin--[acetyl-CoA-carboxylase] ligase [Candidatus Sumerlaeaceae bacterium]|nr:biotin--[acetyl-CoA-carboxylase] ligase [Candidatus Sumerlaeaceae bacterium]
MSSITRPGLEEAVAGIDLVRRAYYFETIDSTSDWAKALIERSGGRGDFHGTLVFANHQTAGRGRQKRQWVSPPGKSLLFSLILDPAVLPVVAGDASSRLLAYAGPVAVCETLRDAGIQAATIKYPNDVLISNRKVSGTLLELISASGRGHYVLGVGLNVSQQPGDLPSNSIVPATSVALETKSVCQPQLLLRGVLLHLERLLSGDSVGGLAARMNLLCDTIGKLAEIQTPAGVLSGTALRIEPDGGLVMRLDSGIQQTIYSGDVIHLTGGRS